MSQISFLDIFDIYSIVCDSSVRNIIETVYKVCYCGFSGSRSSYEGDLLTGLSEKRYMMEDGLAFLISEINVVETNVSLKFHKMISVVGGYFPRPYMCPCR